MVNVDSKKNGFTLVEVLVVIIIMGVLSSMGVISMRNAVVNNRVRDYALNTAAFLERIANDASRMSKTLCVRVMPKMINVYESNCADVSNTTPVFDQFPLDPNLDSPAHFGCNIDDDIDESQNWVNDDGVAFVPRIGLSAAPSNGFVCIQYGSDEIYGLAIKEPGKNMMVPKWSAGGGWQKL